METPSLVIVGAPHFFSSTTLRPVGPRVTLTASPSVFIPRSRLRRASSSKAIIFAMGLSVLPDGGWMSRTDARDGRSWRLRLTSPESPAPHQTETVTHVVRVLGQ